ncbi:MAG TPA: hypothetical protein VKQ31_09400 [Steroidobacteraceae bacterium]|nr:hypothetical protein [Steroidobacteraceae bacterium]
MSGAGNVRARNLRTVAALAALYVLPLAFAFYLYYGSAWRPLGHVNRGTLIEPPRPLPALALPPGGAQAFRGTWTLVAIGDGACDSDCSRALLVMRQVHLALNRDMTRVARLYIATGHCCGGPLAAPGDGGTAVLAADSPALAQALQLFPAAERPHSVFVVDPLGNLMMSYDARTDPRGLLIDLQQLLRLSHIG